MSKIKFTPKKLRVCHFPQIPCKPFIVDVADEREAMKIVTTLADQHLFLFKNNFIPDYSNVFILEMWDESGQEWEDYWDEEHGEWDDVVEILTQNSTI